MPRLTLWKNKKTNNYKFFDNTIKQSFDIAGTAVWVHKYLGPKPKYERLEDGDPQTEDKPGIGNQPHTIPNQFDPSEVSIQDLFYLENRDRKYSEDVYELRGVYTPSDISFDLRQFGLFLGNDNIVMYFHYNDMVDRIGRPLMAGDVLELPHLRMNHLDPTKPAINKFYVVQDAGRDPASYSWTWHFHIWRTQCVPINDQQEFADILEKTLLDYYGDPVEDGTTIGEAMSTKEQELEINDALLAEAERQVRKRKFQHCQIYILPEYDMMGNEIPYDTENNTIVLAYGDGVPPNGATLVGKGTRFPDNPNDGDYFLRIDYEPEVLFRYENGIWKRVEFNWRTLWKPMYDGLEKFIEADGDMRYQNTGKKVTHRQYISKTLRRYDDKC